MRCAVSFARMIGRQLTPMSRATIDVRRTARASRVDAGVNGQPPPRRTAPLPTLRILANPFEPPSGHHRPEACDERRLKLRPSRVWIYATGLPRPHKTLMEDHRRCCPRMPWPPFLANRQRTRPWPRAGLPAGRSLEALRSNGSASAGGSRSSTRRPPRHTPPHSWSPVGSRHPRTGAFPSAAGTSCSPRTRSASRSAPTTSRSRS